MVLKSSLELSVIVNPPQPLRSVFLVLQVRASLETIPPSGRFCSECHGLHPGRIFIAGASLTVVFHELDRFSKKRLYALGPAHSNSVCPNYKCYQMTPPKECKMNYSNCTRSIIWSLDFTSWPLGEKNVTSFKLLLHLPQSSSFYCLQKPALWTQCMCNVGLHMFVCFLILGV